MSINVRYSEFATTKETIDVLKVSADTLRRWEKTGKIDVSRTGGNQRRYNLKKYLNLQPVIIIPRRNFIYTRVSTSEQKSDLNRQAEVLLARYPNHECIRDVGSGLNFKRKGFKTLVEHIVKGDVNEIVVSHRDRLCRFGFELLEHILHIKNPSARIVVLNQEETTPESELSADIISIITVFSSRLYGLRSGKNKKIKLLNDATKGVNQDNKNKTETNSDTEEVNSDND